MPMTAAFRVKYPSSVIVNAGSVDICKAEYNANTYPMSCSVDTTNSFILLNSGLTLDIPADATLKLTFGPITNPRT
jgi:hypothetical protein